MPNSDWKRLDNVVAAIEEDLLATPDAELLREAASGEIDDLRRRLSARRPAPVRARRAGRNARLPSDPAERRALLKLLLSRPSAPRLAVGFAQRRNLADKDVEELLLRLLQSGELGEDE